MNQQNARDIELREQDRWLPIANVARIMKIPYHQQQKFQKMLRNVCKNVFPSSYRS